MTISKESLKHNQRLAEAFAIQNNETNGLSYYNMLTPENGKGAGVMKLHCKDARNNNNGCQLDSEDFKFDFERFINAIQRELATDYRQVTYRDPNIMTRFETSAAEFRNPFYLKQTFDSAFGRHGFEEFKNMFSFGSINTHETDCKKYGKLIFFMVEVAYVCDFFMRTYANTYEELLQKYSPQIYLGFLYNLNIVGISLDPTVKFCPNETMLSEYADMMSVERFANFIEIQRIIFNDIGRAIFPKSYSVTEVIEDSFIGFAIIDIVDRIMSRNVTGYMKPSKVDDKELLIEEIAFLEDRNLLPVED